MQLFGKAAPFMLSIKNQVLLPALTKDKQIMKKPLNKAVGEVSHV